MGKLGRAVHPRVVALAALLVTACGGSEDAGLAPVEPRDGGSPSASNDASARDAAFPADATTAPDASAPRDDAGLLDAGVTDSASGDANAIDAGPLDAATRDSGAADAGARDAGAPDTGVPDAAAPPGGDLGCGTSVSYTRIGHNLTTSDVTGAAFAPDGSFALTVARDGTVMRYRSQERDLALVGKPASTSFSALRFLASGDAVLGGACASGSGSSATTLPCLYRYASATGALTRISPGQTVSGAGFAGLAVNAAGTSVLGASFASNVLYLYGYDAVAGTLAYAAGFGTTTGPTGVAWGRLNARDVALVSGGVNGSEIVLYDPSAPQATRMLRVNSSYSNLGAVAARPGAEEFFLCDGSRNLVRYDGVLTAVQSPFYACNGVAFSSDGASALFVGRPRGTPLLGSVALYRGARGSFAAANVTDVSVPSFSANPYQADTNAHLLGAAWRPGACEGLVVGARGNGPNLYGMVLRFALP